MELPPKRPTEEQLGEFAQQLIDYPAPFRVSSRGWGYLLEGDGLITKDQFDRVETLINRCRKDGIIPIDFIAEEQGRQFKGIEIPDTDETVEEFIQRYVEDILRAEVFYTPDWWDGEEYYIQMVVEKIDLVSLFEPVCQQYHIPIATGSGWASMLMRAKYARRFKEAEERGLSPVLLYCGDHDPDGLRISDKLKKNLNDLRNIYWENGDEGYDPANLIIDRFGLSYQFIQRNNLTWIDNLITGSGKNLASPSHKNNGMRYVQDYLKQIGERKCEANALIKKPQAGRGLCRDAIKKYLGPDALARFQRKREGRDQSFQSFRDDTGLTGALENALELIEGADEDE